MLRNPDSMGKDNIGKLLFQQSLPAIIGMFVMSLYNFVDTIFIGRLIGVEGITVLSIIFPIQLIIGAFAMALGIGAASIISRKLGEQKYEYVSKTFSTFQISNILLSVIFTILGLIFIKPLMYFFGADQEIFLLGKEYFSILLIGISFLCFNMGNNNIIRAVGHSKIAMIIMLSSAIINIILDPILIFVFDMGMSGAAWATVFSRIIGTIVSLNYYFSKKNVIKNNYSDYKIDFPKLKEILLIGFPSLVRQVATSGIVIFINNLLFFYGGNIAIAAYGVINRVLMLFFMPMFGIIQGMQPILGYNYGAGLKDRVKKITILSTKILTISFILVGLILYLFPTYFLGIFSNDNSLLTLSVNAMKVIVLMFPLIGLQFVASGYYQTLGKVKISFFIAILRQVLLLIPIILILSKLFGLNGIRYAFPISDFIAGLIIYFIFRKELKNYGKL